jgi:HTH-type transcriptional regulator, sugar sensing transcriptional regulator
VYVVDIYYCGDNAILRKTPQEYRMSNLLLFKQIKQLGFTDHEAKCYLTLFERESLLVSEIAKLAGIPRKSAYEALEKLTVKGLAVSLPGNVKRYAASDPWILQEKLLEVLKMSTETDLENMKKRQQANLERKMNEILDREKAARDNMNAMIGKIDSLYKNSRGNGNPLENIEVLKAPLQIVRRALQLKAEVKTEILAFTKPPYFQSTDKFQREQDQGQLDAIRRGVKVKCIYEIPVEEPERTSFFESFSTLITPGEEARVIEKLPIRLEIFDRKRLLYAMEDPLQGKLSFTSITTDYAPLAECFVTSFHVYWEQAKDYYIFDNRKYYISELGRGKSKRDRKP